MPDININTNNLREYGRRLNSVNNRLTALDTRLHGLYSKVGLLGLWNLICADAIVGYSRSLRKCRDYLVNTAADFEAAERLILQTNPMNFSPPNSTTTFLTYLDTHFKTLRDQLPEIKRALQTGLGPVGYGAAESIFNLIDKHMKSDQDESFVKQCWDAFWDKEISITDGNIPHDPNDPDSGYEGYLLWESEVSAKPSYGSYSDDKALGEKWDLNVEQKKIKDKAKQTNPDESWYSKDGTVLEIEDGASLEGSVYAKNAKAKSDYAQGSVTTKIVTGEVHGTLSGGLYVYSKDANGNTVRMLSPGVTAEVGTSVAAFDVSADGRIGLGKDNNMLGVYGKGELRAASAEANAKFAMNSKEAYLGASAEADLVKLDGSAGVSVLGTDLGVSGALKVGVGAHAKAGYTDGKLKVDIGAAVGVGFDLGFEVDINGTVDAVTDLAESAWDGVKTAWNWFF